MAEQPSLWDQPDLLNPKADATPATDEPAAGATEAAAVGPAAPEGSEAGALPEDHQPEDHPPEGGPRAGRPGASAQRRRDDSDQLQSRSALDAGRRPSPLVAQPAQPLSSAPTLPTLTPPGRRPLAPERILILDTETTALSPEQGDCIEVGVVLFHVPSRSPLQQLSFLLPTRDNPAEAINGIPAAVTRLSQPVEAARSCLMAMVASAEAVVAHNAAFDRQWFGSAVLPDLGLPWICSMEEIRWPPERQLRPNPSVRDLALAYGVPVWAAHRALTDCQYLVHVFQRCPDLEELLAAAREPRQLYRARLSYAERHRAKEAGFRWNAPVPGAWSRRLSLREVEALPFPVLPVESEGPGLLPHTA